MAYVSLFSYFSSRKRFGVVANNNRRIKDLYLIPLGSKDPLPSKLLPFDGPGKHVMRYMYTSLWLFVCKFVNIIVFMVKLSILCVFVCLEYVKSIFS